MSGAVDLHGTSGGKIVETVVVGCGNSWSLGLLVLSGSEIASSFGFRVCGLNTGILGLET